MSAVIYVAIVVMWAVVLVPMWLRRHDAATETRSVDRFSTAMRTLSRRTSATPGRRYVVMPRRGESRPSVHVSGAAAAAVAAVASRRPPRRTTPARPGRGKASLVARRRRLLLGMSAVTLLTFLIAVIGVISWPLQFVVDVVLVAFCIHLRSQAKRSATLSRRRPAAPARPVAAPVSAPARYVAPATVAAGLGATTAHVPVDEPVDVPMSAPAASYDEVADETWDPVPVPRPTYTMKPPAPAYEADPTYRPPVYDPAARTAAQAVDEHADGGGETDLDEILERRRAVND